MRSFDVNSRATRFTAYLLGVVGAEAFILQPGLVQGFVDLLGLSDRAAGFVASAEMTGVAMTAIVACVMAHRVNWHRALKAALLLALLGNVASAFADGAWVLAGTRFAAGLGHGWLISLSFGAIGLMRQTDRNFALYLTCVLSYGAIGLLVLPTVFDTVGLQGIFLAFSVFCGLSLLTVRFMPTFTGSHQDVHPTAIDMPLSMKRTALLGVLAYNIAQGIAWAYLFLIGTNGGLAEQPVANALFLSQIAGVGGALIAVVVADRYGRLGPLAIGILGGAASLTPLLGSFGLATYTVSVVGFNLLWNMVLPYILAAVSSFDRRGLMTIYAIAMQMTGLGVAPGIAAFMLTEESGYAPLIMSSIGFFLVSFALILFVTFEHRRVISGQAAG